MNSIPKGYRKTEVGVIPEDWEVGTFKLAITRVEAGTSVNSWNHSACFGEIGILKTSCISSGIFEKIENKRVIDQDISRVTCPLVEEKILVSRMNTPMLVGMLAIVPRGNYSGLYLPDRLWSLSVNTHYFDAYFVHHWGHTNRYRQDVTAASDGTSASMKNISKSRFLDLYIPQPPLPEQKAIAQVLSDMDALIEAQKELIAKKQDIKQGTMQELLSGRVRLPGYETKGWKHTDIGDIPDDWEVKELGEISDIISGGTPKTTEKSFWNGTILWCTPTDITRTSGRYIESTEKTITDNGLKNSSAVLLPINSLLLCSRATVGDVRIAKHEITTNQGFKSLICNSSAYYLFIYYLIPSLKPKMLEKSYGSTFLEISKSNLSSIQMQLPSYAEQKAIAQVLSDIDDEIETLEAELEKLNHMKRGMMQELLTGRIRLV